MPSSCCFKIGCDVNGVGFSIKVLCLTCGQICSSMAQATTLPPALSTLGAQQEASGRQVAQIHMGNIDPSQQIPSWRGLPAGYLPSVCCCMQIVCTMYKAACG